MQPLIRTKDLKKGKAPTHTMLPKLGRLTQISAYSTAWETEVRREPSEPAYCLTFSSLSAFATGFGTAIGEAAPTAA